jgi:hypothetical protein
MTTESDEQHQKLVNAIETMNLNEAQIKEQGEKNLFAALDLLLDPNLDLDLDLRELQNKIDERFVRAHDDRNDQEEWGH